MSDRPTRGRRAATPTYYEDGVVPQDAQLAQPQPDPAVVVTTDATGDDAPVMQTDPGPVPPAPPPMAPVAPAPTPATPEDPARHQAILHLEVHLAELKAIVAAFPHKLEGKLGAVVAYLKENL